MARAYWAGLERPRTHWLYCSHCPRRFQVRARYEAHRCHEPKALVSPCDGGSLVLFCCAPHARRSGSVGGANVEYPNDREPYARPVGPSMHDVMRELEADGFDVTEGA